RYELNQTYGPDRPQGTRATGSRPSTGRPTSSHVPPQPDTTRTNQQVKPGTQGNTRRTPDLGKSPTTPVRSPPPSPRSPNCPSPRGPGPISPTERAMRSP